MKPHEYLQFFVWNGHHDKAEVAALLQQRRPAIIEYISAEEWFPSGTVSDILLEYADKYDCELRLLMNAYEKWRAPEIRPTYKNVTYEDNPTLIFYYVLNNYRNQVMRITNASKGNDVFEFDPNIRIDNIKYNVISMTNKVQAFRSRMIDHFQEYDIINDRNCIIWQNNGTSDYEFKFFKPRPITRDNFLNSNGTFNSFELPMDYSKSWFAAIAESTMDIITMTEKSITPLLFMKPFIILGCRGYHRFLQSIGFKLFDEFIDYTFDLVADDDQRVQLFAQEVKKVSELSIGDIKHLNNLIRDKLIHNKQQLYKIYYSPLFEPKYTTGWKQLGKSADYIYHKEENAQLAWYTNATSRGWYDRF